MAEFFKIQNQASANVIELDLPDSIDALEFDQLNESIISLVNGQAKQAWVMDLSSVEYMGSAMLGLIVNIRHQIKTAGGRLVLCGLSARLNEIFRASSLERLFKITRNRAEAMKTIAN